MMTGAVERERTIGCGRRNGEWRMREGTRGWRRGKLGSKRVGEWEGTAEEWIVSRFRSYGVCELENLFIFIYLQQP